MNYVLNTNIKKEDILKLRIYINSLIKVGEI